MYVKWENIFSNCWWQLLRPNVYFNHFIQLVIHLSFFTSSNRTSWDKFLDLIAYTCSTRKIFSRHQNEVWKEKFTLVFILENLTGATLDCISQINSYPRTLESCKSVFIISTFPYIQLIFWWFSLALCPTSISRVNDGCCLLTNYLRSLTFFL